jgi:hypothetical protein
MLQWGVPRGAAGAVPARVAAGSGSMLTRASTSEPHTPLGQSRAGAARCSSTATVQLLRVVSSARAVSPLGTLRLAASCVVDRLAKVTGAAVGATRLAARHDQRGYDRGGAGLRCKCCAASAALQVNVPLRPCPRSRPARKRQSEKHSPREWAEKVHHITSQHTHTRARSRQPQSTPRGVARGAHSAWLRRTQYTSPVGWVKQLHTATVAGAESVVVTDGHAAPDAVAGDVETGRRVAVVGHIHSRCDPQSLRVSAAAHSRGLGRRWPCRARCSRG